LKIKKILISQPEPATGKSPYIDLAKEVGAEVKFQKFIHMEGLSTKEFRDQRITILSFQAVVFTNRVSVDNYFRLAEAMRCEIPVEMRYFCSSESVANYLQKYIVYRKRKIFYSKNGQLSGLMTEMQRYKDSNKFLVPMSEVHSGDLPKLLDKNGYDYSIGIMYRTVSSDLSEINIEEQDLIAFFSPLGVESLFHNFPDFKQGETAIAVFGKGAESAAEKAGLRIDVLAPNPKASSMKSAIEQYIGI
jgi:uroporphyrinogen-III synthase